MNSLKLAVLLVSLFFVAKQVFAQGGGQELGIIPIVIFGAIFIVALVLTLYWVYILFKILTAKNEKSWKILWFLVVFFLGYLGLIIYLFVGKKKRIDKKDFAGESPAKSQPPFAPAHEKPSFSGGTQKYVPKLERLGKSDLFGESKSVSLEEKSEKPLEPSSFGEPKVETPQPQPSAGVLSGEEQEQVNQLVGILEEEKQSYSSDQIKKVVLEKGYSTNVAEEVAKKLYG